MSMPAYTQLLTAAVCCCGSDLPSLNHCNCSCTSIRTEAVVEPAYKLSCHHVGAQVGTGWSADPRSCKLSVILYWLHGCLWTAAVQRTQLSAKMGIRFEGIKIEKNLIWQQRNSIQCELNFLIFSISNCNFLAISAGDVDLVVVNETLKRALVLWNRAAAQGRMISSLAPQAPCLIRSLGTRPLHRVWYWYS